MSIFVIEVILNKHSIGALKNVSIYVLAKWN